MEPRKSVHKIINVDIKSLLALLSHAYQHSDTVDLVLDIENQTIIVEIDNPPPDVPITDLNRRIKPMHEIVMNDKLLQKLLRY